MFSKIIQCGWVSLTLMVFLVSGGAQAEMRELKVPGLTVFEDELADKIVIEISTKPREKLTVAELDVFMNTPTVHFGLNAVNDPVIHRIKVTWGSLPPKFLSPSSFSDLHNPAQAEVEMKGENLMLFIRGGDAAGSYRAQLEIAPHGLVKRWVYNLLSGDEQTSTYSYGRSYIESVNSELKRGRNIAKEKNRVKQK